MFYYFDDVIDPNNDDGFSYFFCSEGVFICGEGVKPLTRLNFGFYYCGFFYTIWLPNKGVDETGVFVLGVPNKPPDEGASNSFAVYFDPNKPPDDNDDVYYFFEPNKPSVCPKGFSYFLPNNPPVGPKGVSAFLLPNIPPVVYSFLFYLEAPNKDPPKLVGVDPKEGVLVLPNNPPD